MTYLLVFVGGGLGSAARHFVNVTAARLLGVTFPWGTLIVNVTGSTAMGILAAYFAYRGDATQSWRLFFTTGILGGYTTFSSFSLDVVSLYERGETGVAALYVAASLAVSIAGLVAGLMVVRQLS